MTDKVVITKVGEPKKHTPMHKTKKATKSILKVKGVADPAKPPPFRREMKKHTLRMLTDKGMRNRKKTLKRKIASLKKPELERIVKESNLVLNPNTPPEIQKQILHNAVSAGFVSL